MLDLSATRQQASTTVNCAQKLSSCTICRDKLHCSDKIIPPAGPLPQLFWVCRWHCTLRDSHASAATYPMICIQPPRYPRQLEDLPLPSSPASSSSFWSTWISWRWSDCNMSTPKRHYHFTCCWRLQPSEDPNAMPSALPTFAIASIPGAPSIRKSHISSSRKPIWKIKT